MGFFIGRLEKKFKEVHKVESDSEFGNYLKKIYFVFLNTGRFGYKITARFCSININCLILTCY